MLSKAKGKVKSSKIDQIYVPHTILIESLKFLRSHGHKGVECDLHWCGKRIASNKSIVTRCVYPEQYATPLGVKVEASEVAKIYLGLHERNESLLAQVHSHPFAAFHSFTDDLYPIMQKPGLMSIVVPKYGFIKPKDFFLKSVVYEYQAHGVWRRLDGDETRTLFSVLPQDFEEELFSRTKFFVDHLNLPSDRFLSELKASKVAVIIDEDLMHTYRGQHMLAACINLLTRCYVNIDVFLPKVDVASIFNIPLLERISVDELVSMHLKINPNSLFRVNPKPHVKYDVALIIGENKPIEADWNIYINSSGWLSYVSTEKPKSFSGDRQNPIGPLVAACYGSTETFKILINKIFKTKFNPASSLTFSALDYGINRTAWHIASLPNKIPVDEIWLVGAGAIGTAVAYTLASLVAVSGRLIIIDPEIVDVSNLNRYVLVDITEIGLPKVNVVKRKLEKKAYVEVFKGTYQKYGNADKLGLVVVTVDNANTRWDVQLDFPKVVLNGGMYANSFTISRHDDFLRKACLGCLYPSYSGEISSAQQYPAVSFVSMFAGTLLAGEVLKERVSGLRGFRLDNAFMINDIFATPKIGETCLLGRINKSDNCGCRCGEPEVIKAYKSHHHYED